MSRVKRGTHHVKRRKNILKRTKGFKWGRKSKLKVATIAAIKAGAYAYRDRRANKRNFRRLWQVRINAAARQHGLSYSRLMDLLKKAGIELDRKILSQLAMEHEAVFKKLVEEIKK
jgi:large subunit ribosomal protein L20